MAKPWSRYQVGFINHTKFRALPANAILLWLEGKNYADEHLTDGYLPLSVIKGFRFYSKRNAEFLMQSAGQKDAAGTAHYAPLWEPHAVGVRMHDYLDHNECRDATLERLAQNDEERKKDRDRKAAARAAKEARNSTECPPGIPPDKAPLSEIVQPDSGSIQNTEYREREERAPSPVLTDDESASRARAFLELYPQIYAKVRNGAVYRPREARDFPNVLQLVTTYPDIERLSLMAEVYLRRTDRDAFNQPGSINQFAVMAPQCDTDLRAHGR